MSDDLIERIIARLQQPTIMDLAGCIARTKRAQRDFEVRSQARIDLRRQIVGIIRSFKKGNRNDPMVELKKIQEAGGQKTYIFYTDIELIAHTRLVDVEIHTCLVGKSGHTEFVAKLNARGLEALSSMEKTDD